MICCWYYWFSEKLRFFETGDYRDKNYELDYNFDYEPSEEGVYSSVQDPKIIDDWFPWIFAKINNKKTFKKGTDKDILAIDFVNIC